MIPLRRRLENLSPWAVSLGLAEASFADIARGLKGASLRLRPYQSDPGRNGLGLNNILYISMLQHYFERRVAEQKTAGQLLLVEEPEAHLHPQLQRVLLATLQRKNVQVFITTHSTHITFWRPARVADRLDFLRRSGKHIH